MSPAPSRFHRYLTERAGVRPEHLEALCDQCRTRTYAKGERLLSRGGINEHIFFVESGLLRFYSIDAKGREHILQFAPEDWWLSDRNNLCSGEPTPFFIDAHEPTTVVLLDQTFFDRAGGISEEFRTHHERILHRHIQQLYNRINLLIGHSAGERYREFLATYPNLLQRVPQWMVASYLGITPEALSRIRRERPSA